MTDIGYSNWDRGELGSLAEFRNGVNYTKDNFGKGIKIINVKDFQDYSVPNYIELDEINPDGVVSERNHLQENDIVFVRSNGNKELIGRSLMLLSLPPEPVTHSAFTIRARIISPKAFPRFFSYVLRSDLIRQVLSAQGNGTNISNLNQAILSQLQVPIPPLPTQRRIASILSTYDDLIENNTRRIEILEEMARRLYEEWFVRFRFPGHEEASFVETGQGLLPEGWRVLPLADVADLKWGDTSITKKAYVEEGYVAYSAAGPDGFLSYYDFNRKGIVLSAIGANCGTTWFALEKWSCIKNTIRYWAKTNALSDEYLFLATKGKDFWPKRGSAQPFISQGDARRCSIVVPPTDLVKRFNSIAEPAFNLTDSLVKKNANLRAQRDLLLPKLISGQIDVSHAEEMATEETAA